MVHNKHFRVKAAGLVVFSPFQGQENRVKKQSGIKQLLLLLDTCLEEEFHKDIL